MKWAIPSRVPDQEPTRRKTDVFCRQERETNSVDILSAKEFVQYDLGINLGSHILTINTKELKLAVKNKTSMRVSGKVPRDGK